METNETGQVISYEEYHPFGTSAYRTAKSNTDLSLKRYRFTNKERDDETGLYYFGVRYYAAWLGRWTSSDPGGFVDGLNMYVYVRNNPVKLVDEEGYEGVEPPLDDLVDRGQANGLKPNDLVDRGQFDGVENSLVLLGSNNKLNNGKPPSTHTDDNGNVIAVFDDGDNGIYKHNDICSEHADKLCTIESKSDLGTSRGGVRMGTSLTPYSFADFGELEKGNVIAAKDARIDFGSRWALENSMSVMSNVTGLTDYFLNAGTGGDYDIKVEAAKEFGSVYYGSILTAELDSGEIIYSSARDAGNFAAGYVKHISSIPSHVTTIGFGAYNHSGNSKTIGFFLSLEYFFLGIGAPSTHEPEDASPLKAPFYGEDKGTGLAIEKGVEFAKTVLSLE
jgi:RHS repeat-associated protein